MGTEQSRAGDELSSLGRALRAVPKEDGGDESGVDAASGSVPGFALCLKEARVRGGTRREEGLMGL